MESVMGKVGWCGFQSPHPRHAYKYQVRSGRTPAFYATCIGVPDQPKLRHKHTLKIHPRNKRHGKVFNMQCTDCNVIFQFRRPSIHRLVTGKTTHYNPQMVLDWFIEGETK